MAGGLTTTYQYVNGQLLGEEHSDGTALRFTYDPFGALSGIQYKSANGSTTEYYVRCTLNGDVDQIYDTSGNLLARYIYDSWGRTVSILNGSGQEILTGDHIAVVNPIRYRGYYYDGESGLYYLQSRYYDAKTGRYVNPDGYVYTGQDILSGNMYAYCGNNPIINIDPTGRMYIEGADMGGGKFAGGGGAAISGIGSAGSSSAGALLGLLISTGLVGAATATHLSSGTMSSAAWNSYQASRTKQQTSDVSKTIPRFADESPRRHHIVAQNDHRAAPARQVLVEVGINFRRDPINIVTIPQVFHKSMHTEKYYIYVNEKLQPYRGTYDYAGVANTLIQLRYEILVAAEGGPIPWI